MNRITGTNKSFPLKPANEKHLTASRLKEAIAAIAFDAHHAGGGMFIVTHYAGTMKVTRFDNVAKIKLSVPYDSNSINEIIDDTVFNIKHSMDNPEPYVLQQTLSSCRGKVLLVALATPVSLDGTIVPDGSSELYGWDILLYAVDGADIDVLCVKGEPVAGTTSKTGSLGRSALMPYLYFNPNRDISLWRLFAFITGKELPRFLFNR